MWMYWLKHRKSEPLEVGPRNLHFTSFPGSAKAGGIEWCKCLCESMATHFSVLAWRIPWTERPGRLQSMESHRVGHNWSDLAVAAAYLWKYKRNDEQPVICQIDTTFKEQVQAGKDIGISTLFTWVSMIAQLVKNLPVVQETPVRFLGWEDLLEKG